MSLIVAAGQIIAGDPNTYQAWDPSRSMNPEASTFDNKGCAPGWATIYVQDSLSGNTVKVCRRLDQSVLGPGAPAVIAEETGMDWYDQSLTSIAEAAEDVVTTAGGVIEAAIPIGLTTAAVLGMAALLLLAWKK